MDIYKSKMDIYKLSLQLNSYKNPLRSTKD